MAWDHREMEPRWQRLWDEKQVFKTTEDPARPKKYILDMFPYPSGAGIHIGHVLNYTATDIIARYYRAKGYNVLHPTGWDAFGLPAEQNAVATGEHPADTTFRCIDNFRRQLKMIGLSYDWSREVNTCTPEYYKWTQWIFRLLYEKGLAYQAEMFVNWCPALKTVLANEEVIAGRSERGDHPVFRVPMRQWMLKITAYAERLLDGLDKLDWPDSLKEIQRQWIGRSEGAHVRFAIADHADLTHESIEVFTTRPDTLFGVTYMVLAPEHPLVNKITTTSQKAAVNDYREVISKKSDLDRTDLNKEKSGVFTGGYAINPVNNQKVPVWIGDYVLMGYGTGAIMAVPGHDTRDHEFASKYELPIVQVIAPVDGAKIDIKKEAFTAYEGVACNSDFLNGLGVVAAKKKIAAWLEEKKLGKPAVTYKFRDWLFSRQRYWGEPFPVLKNAEGEVVRLLRDDEMPLTLPTVKHYEPADDGRSPLARVKEWHEVRENGQVLYRETDTMPGSAGSSWYFLRYCDPHNAAVPFDYEKAKFWMPVDLYIGGQEHAVGHLLYSRFWTKVLYDAGLCPVDEPFMKLINQGMITMGSAKMSKSKGNTVNPDDLIEKYGMDSLRTYEMFMGPLTQTKEWDESNLGGIYRFLGRVSRAMVDDATDAVLADDAALDDEDLRVLHKCIKKVSHDIEAVAYNTAISQLMILTNHIYAKGLKSRKIFEPLIKMLQPFAPHIAEELWQKVIMKGASPKAPGYQFVALAPWPEYDESLTTDDVVTIGVQINGKVRGEITIAKDANEATAMAAVMNESRVGKLLEGKEIKKKIYVPGKILNLIVPG